MYALVALLGAPRRRRCFAARLRARRQRGCLDPGFAVALAALLYTHNWALFFGAGCAASRVLVLLARRADRRALAARRRARLRRRRARCTCRGCRRCSSRPQHTGAPWSTRRSRSDALGAITGVLGGAAAGDGLRALRRRCGLAGLRGGPRACASPRGARRARAADRSALVALALAWTLVADLARVGARATWPWRSGRCCCSRPPGWRTRAGWGIVACCCARGLWARPADAARSRTRATSHDRAARSARACARRPRRLHPARADPGPALLPARRRLRYATHGPGGRPAVMDWRDALDRLKATRPRTTAAADRLAEARTRVVLVEPIVRSATAGARRGRSSCARAPAQWQHPARPRQADRASARRAPTSRGGGRRACASCSTRSCSSGSGLQHHLDRAVLLLLEHLVGRRAPRRAAGGGWRSRRRRAGRRRVEQRQDVVDPALARSPGPCAAGSACRTASSSAAGRPCRRRRR